MVLVGIVTLPSAQSTKHKAQSKTRNTTHDGQLRSKGVSQMSNQRAFDLIQIDSPCTADWDSMIGTDQVRFCQHCQLTVREISQFNEKQIDRLLRRSGDRLCIRYSQPKSTTAQPKVLHQIARRTSLLARTAFSAGLTLSTAIGASARPDNQQGMRTIPAAAARESASSRNGEGSGIIRGVIFDPNSATVGGATVKLSGNESGRSLFSITNDAGEYVFTGLDVGSYNLRVEARGFASSDIPNIVLRDNDDNRIDQTLSIQPITETVEVVTEIIEFQGGAAHVRFATEPLVRAAQQNNLEELNSLLISQKNVNIRDSATGNTALEFAVQNGNREVVQALLWAKADVNAKNRSGQTALMMLTDKVTADILWDLINAGAKVNLKDNDGDTALSEVAQINNTEALKVLLDAGAKVNTANDEGETPLMLAAGDGYVNNVRVLLLAGADVNAQSKKGKTALNYARDNDEAAVIRLLISYGAVQTVETEKDSPDDPR